jgi:hypothetical protein
MKGDTMAVDFTPTEKSGKKKAKVKSSDSAISRFRQWLIDSYNGLFKIVIQPQLPSLRTLGLLVVAFVIGLIWAYVISPTSFYNASPNQLSAGQRDQYIILLAGAKQGQLYDDGTIVQLLARVERPADAIQRLASSQSGQVQFALQELLPLAQQAGNGTAAPGEGSLIGSLIGFIFAIIVFFLLANIFSLLWGLIIGGYVERFLARFKEETDDDRRAKVAIAEIQRRKKLEVEMKAESAASGVSSPLGEPLLQRISTYTKGRIFDDSFAIEDANDMFLGETGATIAKAIGESQEPTAIEIWLFDKEDFVRTLTKLVVSEHAYNDPVIRSELEPKVENPATDIILAQPGAVIALETNQILVQAKIADMSYGTGPLPPNSYFESLTIQMQAWEQVGSPVGVPKPAAPPMPAAPGLKPLDAYEIGPPPQMPSAQFAPPPPSAGGLPSLDSYEIGPPPQMPSGTSGGFPPAPPARPTSPTPFPPRRPFEDEEDDDPFGGTGDFTPLGN